MAELLELTSEFSKMAEYKVNIWNFISGAKYWKRILNTHLTNVKHIKYLGVSLTKDKQDLSPEQYKMLLTETKTLNTWKDTPYSRKQRLDVVKKSKFPDLLTDTINCNHNPCRVFWEN